MGSDAGVEVPLIQNEMLAQILLFFFCKRHALRPQFQLKSLFFLVASGVPFTTGPIPSFKP